jgi:hypothetical protein
LQLPDHHLKHLGKKAAGTLYNRNQAKEVLCPIVSVTIGKTKDLKRAWKNTAPVG